MNDNNTLAAAIQASGIRTATDNIVATTHAALTAIPLPGGATTQTVAAASPGTAAGTGFKAKVRLSFLSESNAATLILITGHVLAGMNGNPQFATPVPALADVSAARDAYIATTVVARGALNVVERSQARSVLVAQMRALALYVQQTSAGDPAVLLASGFPAQRGRQPAGLLPAPANLRLTRGTLSGQLKARCNVVGRAGSYQWRYASAATPGTWVTLVPTLGASLLLEGLVAGTMYIVQVRAIGSKGASNWSDGVSLMAV